MAIKISDLQPLLGKVENDGATDAGRCSAAEFNILIQALIECIGGVKRINFQGSQFTPNENGVLDLIYTDDANSYQMVAKITTAPPEVLVRGASCPITLKYNCYAGGDVTDVDTSPGSATVMVNGTLITALTQTLRSTGTSENNVYNMDIGPYLTEEENTVRLVVANALGA